MQSAGRLTQRTIAALKPRPGERYVVWDSEVKGFGVRVAAQARTFILKYRSPSGRVRWMSFGRVGAIALERARKRARSAVGVVADGRDPQTQSDAARDAWTLGDVAGRFLKEHVEARRSASTLRLYKLVIDGHLRPRFGAVPITEIGTAPAPQG